MKSKNVYFKRMNYYKEDVESKEFNGINISSYDEKTVFVQDISEFKKENEEKFKKVFDFERASRQKNTGLGDEYINDVMTKFNSGKHIKIKSNHNFEKPIFISFDLSDEENVLYDLNYIELEENAKAKIVIYYDSHGSSDYRNGINTIKLNKHSNLELLKIQNLSDESRNFETNKIICSYRSKLEAFQVEFGSKLSVSSTTTYAREEWSDISIYPLCFVDKSKKMDIEQNLIINGRNTLAIINANSCMKDKSIKMVRGNVFLNKGCKSSIGRFSSSDIMLNSGVKSECIPTILCDEDDVMGEHGASFAPLSKEKLFYLMARGITRAEAKKLIVSATFNPVFELIEEEELRETLKENLKKRLDE